MARAEGLKDGGLGLRILAEWMNEYFPSSFSIQRRDVRPTERPTQSRLPLFRRPQRHDDPAALNDAAAPTERTNATERFFREEDSAVSISRIPPRQNRSGRLRRGREGVRE